MTCAYSSAHISVYFCLVACTDDEVKNAAHISLQQQNAKK